MTDKWLMPGIPRTIAEAPDMKTVQLIQASITVDTGQVVESDLLKPCLFCGGRPYIQVHDFLEASVAARVVCRKCHVTTTREIQSWRVWHGGVELTRTLAIGRAISSWNRRAERTCRKVPGRMKYGRRMPKCSECGQSLGDDRWGYCPKCGARVVRDDD